MRPCGSHIASPRSFTTVGCIAAVIAMQVASAAIRRAEEAGDNAKVDRLRQLWRNHLEFQHGKVV